MEKLKNKGLCLVKWTFFLFFLPLLACERNVNPELKLKKLSLGICKRTIQCYLKEAYEQMEKLPKNIKIQSNLALPPHRADLASCATWTLAKFNTGVKENKPLLNMDELIANCLKGYELLDCERIVYKNEEPGACQELFQKLH
jgi:hypothetical protein